MTVISAKLDGCTSSKNVLFNNSPECSNSFRKWIFLDKLNISWYENILFRETNLPYKAYPFDTTRPLLLPSVWSRKPESGHLATETVCVVSTPSHPPSLLRRGLGWNKRKKNVKFTSNYNIMTFILHLDLYFTFYGG